MNTEAKSIALFGGKMITVTFEPVADPDVEGGVRLTPSQEIKVRQVKISDFRHAEKLLNEDEPAFVAFLVNRPAEFVLGNPAKADEAGKVITPEVPSITGQSYEAILAAAREVNGDGFFTFYQRRTELEVTRNARSMATMLASLPEEQVAKMHSTVQSTLQTSSPRSPSQPR